MTAENYFLSSNTLILRNLNRHSVIGQGNTAELFSYEPGIVLKLFRDSFPEEGVIREWNVTRAVQQVYSDMPKALRLVVYKKRRGILYEYAEGQDMLRWIASNPFRMVKTGKMLAELHTMIHKVEIRDIVNVKDKLCREIGWVSDLTEKEKTEILSRLERLPDGDRLCHFDFHPGNVMISGDKVRVIDWITACSGDPAADLARTYLLLDHGELKNASRSARILLKAVQVSCRESYLRHSMKISGVSRTEVRKWMLPIAAARLSEWLTDSERGKLSELVRNQLEYDDK